MRKRFLINDRLPVKAKPNKALVQVGKSFHIFRRIKRKYLKDEYEWDVYMSRIDRIFKRRYNEIISDERKKINQILGDVYVVIPKYPENAIGEISLIIQSLKDEPNDVIAVEICKTFNL